MTTNDPNLLVLGRLLLEDVCSDLVRDIQAHGDPSRFSTVVIDRELAASAFEFADCPPLDAKNLGSVRPWQMVTTSGACR